MTKEEREDRRKQIADDRQLRRMKREMLRNDWQRVKQQRKDLNQISDHQLTQLLLSLARENPGSQLTACIYELRKLRFLVRRRQGDTMELRNVLDGTIELFLRGRPLRRRARAAA